MTSKAIELKITRNYALTLSEKEVDLLLDALPQQIQAYNYAFDSSVDVKEKNDLLILVRRIESMLEKLQKAINDKEAEAKKLSKK